MSPSSKIRLGIIGFGLIGKQRYRAAIDLGILKENIFVMDPGFELFDFDNFKNLNLVENISELTQKQISHCIISTPHNVAIPYVEKLLDCQIKVLLEKPMGRNLSESKNLNSHPYSSKLSIGFNYRFMPGIQQLKERIELGTFGKVISVKIELGHGGSPADKNSWKLNPHKAGGGALLDPGIHIIDLIQYLFNSDLSDFKISGINSWSGFWNTGIEECVFVIGELNGVLINFSVSLVSWKTKFKVELIGEEGYFEISGRGRSDGPQVVTEGARWAWLNGISQLGAEKRQVLSDQDDSIRDELSDWINEGPDHAISSQAYGSMVLYSRLLDKLEHNDD